MPKKRPSLTERLRELTRLSEESSSPERDRALLAAVSKREASLVVRAVELVQTCEIEVPLSTIEERYAYFTEKGASRDPGCRAKTALIELIDTRDLPLVDLLVTASLAEQQEAVWGGTEDTAAPLRTAATLALVNLRSSRAPIAIADRLAEPSPVARRGGVEALCAWGDELWTPALLRFRLAAGEPELDVRIDLYTGLIEFDRDATLVRLQDTLAEGSGDDVEAAAIALGSARVDEALPWLTEAIRHPLRRRQVPSLVAAIALLRTPKAVDALIDCVRTLRFADARIALEALEPYLDDDATAERIEAAATANPDRNVEEGLRDLRRQ